jgi:hypothetical protein
MLEGAKHQQADGCWFGLVYWPYYGIQVMDVGSFSTEAEVDDWLRQTIASIPLGELDTGTMGAEPICIFELPRHRVEGGYKSEPRQRMLRPFSKAVL